MTSICKISALAVTALLPGWGMAQPPATLSVPAPPSVASPLPAHAPTQLPPGGQPVSTVPVSPALPNQLPLPGTLQGSSVAGQLPIPAPTHPENQLPPPAGLPTPPAAMREPGDRFRQMEGTFPENAFGNGKWCWTGWRFGPCVAPFWEYPGLGGGPKVDYPWGSPGYTGWRNGQETQDRWRFWGPQVPVYTPVPQAADPSKLIYPGRNVSSPGFVYGWIGPFPASPRFKHYAVNVWPQPGTDLSTGGNKPETNMPSGVNSPKSPPSSMSLSVKVPVSGAEVYVDGAKTHQTGTDRNFSSPDLKPGQTYRYEVTVRWVDKGKPCEQSRIVIGTAGDAIALDFTSPEGLQAGK